MELRERSDRSHERSESGNLIREAGCGKEVGANNDGKIEEER